MTDPNCASACLDFLDLTTKLPGVVRIGLPTAADTNYLELSFVPLPSGRATLGYPMKMYMHRARGPNVAYLPLLAWPGGAMTDESILHWINTLQ